MPLGTSGRRPRCVHGKQCHPCRSGPVGGARVVFTGNSATRPARDLWDASRLVNFTTKTTQQQQQQQQQQHLPPPTTNPSWNPWRQSSWSITQHCNHSPTSRMRVTILLKQMSHIYLNRLRNFDIRHAHQ